MACLVYHQSLYLPQRCLLPLFFILYILMVSNWVFLSIGGLKQQKFILSQFRKSEVWNQGVNRVVSYEDPERELFHFSLSVSGDGLQSLIILALQVNPSLSDKLFQSLSPFFTWPSFFCCVSFPFLSLTRTPVFRFRVHSNPEWSHLEIFTSVIPIKILIPNKVTVWGSGEYIFWGPLFNPYGLPLWLSW